MTQPSIRFFLGSNTPSGFRHTAAESYRANEGFRTYLLYGAAGTGKSTLLKRVYERYGDDEGEVYLCSSDPDSWDGVCFERQRICVLDATAPHVVTPSLLGGCEQVVPLVTCVDERTLYEKRKPMQRLTDTAAEGHLRCRRLLAGAAEHLLQNERRMRACLDEDKLVAFAERLIHEEVSPCERPYFKRRFLTAMTPHGLQTLWDTVQALCPRIYVIVDEEGAAAARLMQSLLHKTAVTDRIACPSPLFPERRLNALLLPRMGTAFVVSDARCTVDFPVYRRIHASRFYLSDDDRQKRSFCRRTADEMLRGAAAAMADAAKAHKQLERIVGASTDWDAVSAMGDQLLERL